MDVKKSIAKHICEYYNGHKKTSNYLQDLYASIVMDVKKPITIYETYMQVLQWMKKRNNYLQNLHMGIAYLKWPYGNYNRKDVGIAQCSF
jgi:hypothetical protein